MSEQVFTEEVRTELMSMYTGMALQGLAKLDWSGPLNAGRVAVELADGAITALEEYHLRRKDDLIAARQGNLGLAS